MEVFTSIVLVWSFILILTSATSFSTPSGSGYKDLFAEILYRMSSWRELRCNFCFLTSVRYTQSSLKGCSRLASRIFLITRTLLGGLFHVNRWLAGSWMCLRDKKNPQTSHFGLTPSWPGKNTHPAVWRTHSPTQQAGKGNNSHCRDVSELYYVQGVTQN